MNTRPTRAPSPEIAVADRDAEFTVEAQGVRIPAVTTAHAHEAIARERVAGHEVAPVGEAQPALPKTECNQLIAAIAAVMMEIKPVEKGGWNKFQSYAFARIQDLLVTITPLMGKHGVVVFQHEEGREMFDSGKAIAVRYRFTIVHKSGEVWFERPLQTGLSSCRNSKDGFDDKSLNKCHTAARKYFLMSLFQIPTEDSEDADEQQDGGSSNRPRPQGQQRRLAPSPSGKLPPHILPVIDQERPEAWAARFGAFIAKAESTAEIDKWYEANAVIFEKLRNGGFTQVYNDAIDFMDARAAQLSKPASDPISSGFPGDRPKAVADDLDIPAALDRREKKKPADGISDKERDWLVSLDEAFGQINDIEALSEEQRSIMLPSKDFVGGNAWNKAVDILNKNIERIEAIRG